MSINAHMLGTISEILPQGLREGVTMQPGMALSTATGPTADAHGSGPLLNVVKGMMTEQGVETTIHATAGSPTAPTAKTEVAPVQPVQQVVRPVVTSSFKAPKI
jgi:hypothetical protein